MRSSAFVFIGSTVVLAGCAQHPSASVARLAPTPHATTPVVGKQVEQGSGRMAMTIAPRSGPVGTLVHVRATYCSDADGLNHAVSFNPDTSNQKPDAPVDAMRAELAGETLTASYRITSADGTGSGHGRFYVQCATDLADLPFTITK